jgi:CubicO group peptidase (beta-lactamase class C family)
MNERSTSGKAESLLKELVLSSRVPGIQYLVLDSDRTLFEFAGGWAGIAEHRPMDFRTTLMAYSMSKTITAAAVLQLVQEGKLGLEDSIDRHIDSHPYGPGLRIRHLISHTSGIPNPIPLSWVHSPAEHVRFNERAELAAVLKRYPKLAFPPGQKFKYSNIGYWLLGTIIERASGDSFPEFVRKRILGPLNIESQELDYDIASEVDHARGYLEKYSLLNVIKRLVIAPNWIGQNEGRWLQIHDHFLNGPSFGGLVGTARGFGKFLQDQLGTHSRILDDATRKLFYDAQQTSGGTTIRMTLGWHVQALQEWPFFYKEGGGGGFHCMMRLYREPGMASVVMTNATTFDVRGLMDAIDTPFLARRRT